jgi:hypothetical protein
MTASKFDRLALTPKIDPASVGKRLIRSAFAKVIR